MTGIIFDIKRYAVHDGPGIRTTVFLKGCPLRCKWCHNPESFSKNIQYSKQKLCFDGQQIEKNEIIGREYNVTQITNELLKDQLYYEQSGGGITFSGGEPLMQVDFLHDALKSCKEQFLHTCVDTSGYCNKEDLEKIMPYTDLFLYDIKQMNEEKHKEYTGVSNKSILDNLKFLTEIKKEIIIRYPLIPGCNMEELQLKALEELVINYQTTIKELHLLPFHAIAKGKYERFGITNPMLHQPSLDKDQVLPITKQFSHLGIPVKIGG